MQVVPELAELFEAVASDDLGRRRAAIDAFSGLRLPDAVTMLSPLLESSNKTWRLAGTEALDENTSPTALNWLIEHAKTDTSKEVQHCALLILSTVATHDVRALLLSLEASPDRRVRQLVATGLTLYDDPCSTHTLAMLTVDDDVYVQDHAIESLTELHRSGIPYLFHLLLSLWVNTYREALLRKHADAGGDRTLVEKITEEFHAVLSAGHGRPPYELRRAMRWMARVQPDKLVSWVEDRLRVQDKTSLVEFARESQKLGRALRLLSHLEALESIWALLRQVAEHNDLGEATSAARRALELLD